MTAGQVAMMRFEIVSVEDGERPVEGRSGKGKYETEEAKELGPSE